MEVLTALDANVGQDAQRAIKAPFSVSADGRICLSDTAQLVYATVPEGRNALLFEIGRLRDEEEWCRLTFIPAENVVPEILRADEELSPSYPLLMYADPAWDPRTQT